MRPPTRAHLRLLAAIVLLSTTAVLVSGESSTTVATTTTAKTNETTTTAPPATITTPTTTTTTTATTTTTTTTSTVTSIPSTTTPEPRRDIEEVKKIIQQHIDPNRSEHRLAVNKPTSAPPMADFAPESPEARVAEATTQFGLLFMNNLAEEGGNVVLSPLSLQNLLNMLLLGAADGSASQTELTRLLGYDAARLLEGNRLGPHQAMRSVFQSILAATHLSLADQDLLNTNSEQLEAAPGQANQSLVRAHLQTSVKEGDQPLSGQLNFTLANLVLTNSDLVELKPDYERDLKSYYNVNVEQFSRDTKQEGPAGGSIRQQQQPPLHERVNRWVRNQTQGQIERLADEGDLAGDELAMVLLNAAHFKGRWLHTFNSKATHEGTFFNGGREGSPAKVQFMRQKAVFGYAEFGNLATGELAAASESNTRASDDSETLLTEDVGAKSAALNESAAARTGERQQQQQQQPPTIELSREETRRLELTGKLNCSALMLPFSLNDGQELSIVLLLPAKRDGLGDLQAALTGPALNEIYRSLSEQQVQVELPKFALEGSHDAKQTLARMGLNSIFDPQTAHLDRMFSAKAGAPGQAAKVDKVIHKAKITVDESGAEAAAASMATIVLRNFIRPPTPIFVADHPFLFIIRHNRSNLPLFMGRVSNLAA